MLTVDSNSGDSCLSKTAPSAGHKPPVAVQRRGLISREQALVSEALPHDTYRPILWTLQSPVWTDSTKVTVSEAHVLENRRV